MINYLLLLILCFSIISCGGSSSNSKDLSFPEHLPAENENLSQESPKGIWKVYRIRTSRFSGTGNGVKYESSSRMIEDSISIIDTYNSEFPTLPFCTISDIYEQWEFDIIPTPNGYKQSYSKNPNNTFLETSGNLEVTFINNRKLIGQGTRIYSYEYGDQIETILIHAVKISDETNLNTSTDLIYSSNIETESDLEVDMPASCIALSKFDAVSYENGNKITENHIEYAQLFQLNTETLKGFEIFNTRGIDEEKTLQRIGGIFYDGDDIYRSDYESWVSNILCPIEDIDCLEQGTLELNSIQENNSGIAFNTRFNLSDGRFFNTDISLTINPVITKE